MKKLYILLIIFCIAGSAFAQDKIYKKDGEIIEVKITEIGTDEIKYKLFTESDGPTYSLDKDRILKVIYENGRVESYQSTLKDPKLYADQSKDAIKINFLSPLLGFTQLNFEHNLRPGRSYELSMGIIGLGKRQEIDTYYGSPETYSTTYREARGLFLGAGYKFSKIPDFVQKGAKYSHVMQGSYIKPELSLGFYGQNHYVSNNGGTVEMERQSLVFGGLLINLGKQWVFGELLLVDIYGGLGYALDNREASNERDDVYINSELGNHFALSTGVDSGLGVTGGFKVGLLLNLKKK